MYIRKIDQDLPIFQMPERVPHAVVNTSHGSKVSCAMWDLCCGMPLCSSSIREINIPIKKTAYEEQISYHVVVAAMIFGSHK